MQLSKNKVFCLRKKRKNFKVACHAKLATRSHRMTPCFAKGFPLREAASPDKSQGTLRSPLCCERSVGVPGVEPGTSSLSGTRSNQLSYTPPISFSVFDFQFSIRHPCKSSLQIGNRKFFGPASPMLLCEVAFATKHEGFAGHASLSTALRAKHGGGNRV